MSDEVSKAGSLGGGLSKLKKRKGRKALSVVWNKSMRKGKAGKRVFKKTVCYHHHQKPSVKTLLFDSSLIMKAILKP